MEFPNLTTLGYWEDCGTPANVRWTVPQLQTLLVFCFPRIVETMLNRHWRVTEDEARGDQAAVTTHSEPPLLRFARGFYDRLPNRTAEQCPQLREILCAVVEDNNAATPNTWQVARRLQPPKPLEWIKLRLLHLAVDAKNRGEECPLAQLPEAIMHRVVSYCHRPRWKVTNYSIDLTATDEAPDG